MKRRGYRNDQRVTVAVRWNGATVERSILARRDQYGAVVVMGA